MLGKLTELTWEWEYPNYLGLLTPGRKSFYLHNMLPGQCSTRKHLNNWTMFREKAATWLKICLHWITYCQWQAFQLCQWLTYSTSTKINKNYLQTLLGRVNSIPTSQIITLHRVDKANLLLSGTFSNASQKKREVEHLLKCNLIEGE